MSVTNTGEVALTAMERSTLTHAEAKIERGLATFVEVGEALAQVRDERLYREEFSTFECYCHDRWGLSRSRAYASIDAASMVSRIRDTGAPEPSNQGQAEALSGLASDDAADVMRRAHDATGGKVTARSIREARDPERDPEPPTTPEGEAAPDSGSTEASPRREVDVDTPRPPANPAPPPRPIEKTPEELRESTRRAGITNLRSVLTHLTSKALSPTELADREYGDVLSEFAAADLTYAAEAMHAIAALKNGHR